MKDEKLPQVKQYISKHKKMSVWYKLVTTLAAIVVFATTYMLILPAITLERKPVCGMEEHIHDESCLEVQQVLVCELEEEPEHHHDDNCYDDEGNLVCGLEETEGHTHGDECYEEQQVLVCGLEEHIHSDECYADEDVTEDETATEEETEVSTDTTASSDDEENTEATTDHEPFIGEDDDEVTTVFENTEIAIVETTEEETETTTEALKTTGFSIDRSDDVVSSAAAAPAFIKEVGSDPDSSNVLTVTGVTYSNAEYDYSADMPKASINIAFTASKSKLAGGDEITVGSNNEPCREFYIELPDDMTFVGTLAKNTDHLNQDDELAADREKYYYSFETIDGKDYIHIKVKQSTIDDMQDGTDLNGTIHFGANFGSDLIDENGKITAVFPNSNDQKIIIDNKITYPDYTNGKYDIHVKKSFAEFDKDNSTVSYTVTVYSRDGTDQSIDFKDVTTIDGVTVVGDPQVEVKSGTYYKDPSNSNNYIWEEGSSVSNEPTFDADTKTLTMTLDPLTKYTTTTTAGAPVMNAYRITYTYTLDGVQVVDDGQTSSQTISNTASAEIENKDVKAEDTINGTPIGVDKKHIVVKSGSCDENGVVTWTIVLGDDTTDLNGYSISDSMSDKINDGTLEIFDSNGDPLSDTDYTIDASGKITFNKSDTKFTVTYQTTFGGPNETKADNAVDVYDATGGRIDNRVGTVNNTAVYHSKEYVSMTANPNDTSGDTMLVNWKVNITIPPNGYSQGTVFYDSIADYQNWGKAHYFDKADVQAIETYLNTKYPGVFTVEAKQKETNDFIASSSLTDVAMELRLTLNRAVTSTEFTGEFELEYATVANISEVEDEQWFRNRFTINNSGKEAYTSYKRRVVKKDGKGSTAKSETEDVNGNLTWKVDVLLDEDLVEGDKIVITDTLPDGVEFVKVSSIISQWDNAGLCVYGVDNPATQTWDGHALSFDPDTGVLEITVGPNGVNATNSNPLYHVYVTYECRYTDAANVEPNEKETFELTNTASVTVKGESYGIASQTQDLIVDKLTEEQAVEKLQPVFDMDNNLIKYTVKLNPSGSKYNNEDGPARFNDQFKYDTRYTKQDTNPGWVQYADIELAYDSVKLYYADASTVLNTTTQKYEWVMEKGAEVSASDWKWTSQTATEEEVYNHYYKKTIGLYAEMPDETPLILEYAYRVNDHDGPGHNKTLSVNNSAYLYGDDYNTAESDEQQSSENNWVTSEHGGTAGYKPRYSICKISENNYAMKLDGAVFGLYQYDASTGTYINTGKTFRTGTDGTGIVQITFDATTGLLPNTLYYVTEIEAPVGYVLPSDPEKLYFYMNSSDESISNFPPASDPAMAKAIDVTTKEYVKNIKNEELGNDVTQIQVEKEWYDSENRKFIKTDGSINCSLYRRMNDLSQSENSKTVNLVATDAGNVQQTVNKYAIPGAKITLLYRNNAMHDYQEDYFKFPYVKIVNGGVTILDKQTTADDWIVDVDNNIAEYQFTSTGDVDITASVDFNFGTSSGMDMLVNELDVPLTDDDKHYVTEKVRDFDLTADNDWMISFDDLQKYGEYHGRSTKYTYFVVENTATDGYEVSYWFDGSKYTAEQLEALEIEEGRITIRNTSEGEDETFVLPSTGGIGTYPFTFGGIAVLTAALLFYLRKKAV